MCIPWLRKHNAFVFNCKTVNTITYNSPLANYFLDVFPTNSPPPTILDSIVTIFSKCSIWNV